MFLLTFTKCIGLDLVLQMGFLAKKKCGWGRGKGGEGASSD